MPSPSIERGTAAPIIPGRPTCGGLGERLCGDGRKWRGSTSVFAQKEVLIYSFHPSLIYKKLGKLLFKISIDF